MIHVGRYVVFDSCKPKLNSPDRFQFTSPRPLHTNLQYEI